MRRFELKFGQWKPVRMMVGSLAAAALMLGFAMLMPSATMAQAPVVPETPIHGHVQNAAGFPLTKGEVRLTTDKRGDPKTRKYPYVFPLDANGDFKGSVTPGDYFAAVYQDDKSVDYLESVKVAAGANPSVDFDMTRKEYLDKMSPEERKALEDYKAQASKAMNENKKIQNLNAQLQQARADTKAGNYAPAIAAMKDATTTKPDEAILWIALADAQLGAADADAKTAKAAGKPASDPTVVAEYTDAATSYKKAIDLNAVAKKPNPDAAATAYNQLGQAYGKMGDAKSSSEAYENAAKTQPAQAGMYYYNEAATLYNASSMDAAAEAADKAITADPKRADAYYLKGQALITKAGVDPKTNKIQAPPGCVEAYQMYLQLAPTGPHADDVKGILTGIGESVTSTYKAAPTPKKK
jgi:tetratricopeptide (TPR) repeat protein